MYQDLKNFQLPGDFRGKSKVIVQLWWIVENTFFAFHRNFFMVGDGFFKIFGAKIGKGVLIRSIGKIYLSLESIYRRL